MLVQQVAVVSELEQVSHSRLTRVCAALQKQAVRDFGPIWEVQTTVDPFVSLDDVPLGYWPIIIRDDIGVNAAGIHLDKDGQPFSLVEFSEDWSITASHELLEMLADPFGNRLIAGNSPKKGQGRVEFLVEVCDPCEGADYAYTVNGIPVSDFYTPHFFDPVTAVGVRYSFHGKLTRPHEVLRGGYLSWHDPETDHWWQLRYFGRKPKYEDLGKLTESGRESLRAAIDRLTTPPEKVSEVSDRTAKLQALSAPSDAAASSSARAAMLRQRIDRIRKQK